MPRFCYNSVMVAIEKFRSYYDSDDVFMTNHAAERCRESGILAKDIKSAVMTGEIIEDYPNDFPFPSCLICGTTIDEKKLHVCVCDCGNSCKVITAYVPSAEKWGSDFKTRKEVSK